MPKKGKNAGSHLRLAITALVAIAAIATAAGGGHDYGITAGGPAGCVMLKVGH